MWFLFGVVAGRHLDDLDRLFDFPWASIVYLILGLGFAAVILGVLVSDPHRDSAE